MNKYTFHIFIYQNYPYIKILKRAIHAIETFVYTMVCDFA